MSYRIRLGAVVAAAALIGAVPALADKPPHPTHPAHPTHPTHPTASAPSTAQSSGAPHKCAAHEVAFIAAGTLATWSATANAAGKYSGTIVADVTRTNHHASGSMGTQTFTLASTKVTFALGVTVPAAGDRIDLIGKITAIARACTDRTGAGTITIRHVIVSNPR